MADAVKQDQPEIRWCEDIGKHLIQSISCEIGHPDDEHYQRMDYDICSKCGSQMPTYDEAGGRIITMTPFCYKCAFHELNALPPKEKNPHLSNLKSEPHNQNMYVPLEYYFRSDTF